MPTIDPGCSNHDQVSLHTVSTLYYRSPGYETHDAFSNIVELRSRVWLNEGVQGSWQWFDELDWDLKTAHFTMHSGDRLVAAARISLHDSIYQVPNRDGFLKFDPDLKLDSPIASINRVVVDPEVRGRGFAKALLLTCFSHAHDQGARTIVSCTVPKLISTYLDAGFEILGKGQTKSTDKHMQSIEFTYFIGNTEVVCAASKANGEDAAPLTF